jgi:acetolactate synthase-1/2/3 large subunit
MPPKNSASKDNLKTGGEILVESLRINSVDKIFCVPGESYLAALDAFYDVSEIKLIVCRHESGAAMMADTYARLTGRPGVCFVTRGPGAANASAGLHIAMQDSTPMILLIGQIARNHSEREAFQEVDYRRMFGQMAKWVGQIDDENRVAEYMSHAFYRAQAGRPGPVVLALPEDMLCARTSSCALAPAVEIQSHPGKDDISKLHSLLKKARQPLAIIGGGGWDVKACKNFQAFAEANKIPVCVTFRCQDRFENAHPNYCGDLGVGQNPKLQTRVQDADLLLVIGARLGEISTGGYTLINIPKPKQIMIHVHQGAEELGWVYQPELAINAGMKNFAVALKEMPQIKATWKSWTKSARDDYLAWTIPPSIPGDMQMGKIMTWLNENLDADTIVCNGAGNFSSWANRFYRYHGYGTLQGPTSGSMGFGLPAALAAKLLYPNRTVISFSGDGDFLMTGQEFATAMQYGVNVIVLVGNNSMYGTIRMHQERDYPGRVSGTELVNPNFSAYAEAFGGFGAIVKKTEDFAVAFEAARQSNKPAIIEIRLDPDAISPSATLSGLRKTALDKAKD